MTARALPATAGGPEAGQIRTSTRCWPSGRSSQARGGGLLPGTAAGMPLRMRLLSV